MFWGHNLATHSPSHFQAEQQAALEEAKEASKALERQRSMALTELNGLVARGAMPWLWLSDPTGWQQVAGACSDGGFFALDSAEALKGKDTRQAAQQCIAAPLLQEGQQHSNLLVATVSKLLHGLRGVEGTAAFAADCLLQAHSTPLPRLFLVELTQHCTAQELTSQGAFQRSLAAFLVALSERLPHVVLANISVLLPLLDVDCYPIRQAIVESIGHLLSAEGRKLPSGAHNAQQEETDGTVADPEAEIAQSSSGIFTLAPATKNDLLETLFTRFLDKSVWVRYRVLQTLNNLASNNGLPRELWPRVLDLAIRRMQDTASMSRKAAMQLVRKLVEFHPYGPALKGSGDERAKTTKLLNEIQERMKKLKAEELAELEGADAGDADGAEDAAEPPEKRQKRCKGKTETDVSIAREVDKDLEANGEAGAEDAGESASARHAAREKQREALQRMQQCYAQRVHFVELLDAAEARLRGLLSSKTATDVTEAISVVVELRLRGVPAAARAFHQVLGLVWSRHGPIKDAAVDAFYRMHLEGRDTASAAEAVLQIYKDGFSSGELTHTHLASVQELIQQAAEKELIVAAEVIPKMVSALGDGRAAGALRALTALSATGHDALAKNALPKVQEFICRSSCSPAEQLEHARLVAQLLLRFLGSAKGAVNDAAVSRLCAVSQQCSYLVVQHFVKGEVPPQWFPAAMCAMDLSFELAQHGSKALDAAHRSPDKVWENILNRMLCGILGGQGDGNENGEVEVRKVQVPQLGCVAFVAGHLALRMLIFLEGLQSALKRQRLAQEEAKIAEQREKSKEKKASKKGKGAKAAEEDEDKAETSMGGVGLEEREAEAFAQIAETGLLYSNRLLDRVKPLLFACLLDKELRGYPLIRRVGAISLCKFMTVSKRFCEENLQLLFSVLFPKNGKGQLQGATQEAIAEGGLLEDLTLRQSLLVAVGDLLFRHPNVVEPWTGRLYSTLSTADASGNAVDLRLTALLVLTHLVLNDMMKPRPVLLIRALWLTACNHEATARVARILFQELAKRSTNVVYNLLPEIVARLPEHVEDGVEGGAVARVQYIMQFVEKEKHIEGLIEKFTLRLEQCASGAGGEVAAEAATQEEGEGKTAKVEDTVSCLAHALGAMNYSDRCILRLHDVVVTRKALNLALSYYPVARECLLAVVEKARKPRGKGEDGDAKTAAAAAPAEGEGKASGAAQAALDAMEQLVNTLAHGKEEMEIPATAPVPATAQRKNDAAKRKNAEAEEPGFEEEKKPRKGKGRGRGRADKELSQLLTLASRSSKSQQTSNDLLFKGSFNGFPNLFGTSSSRCFSYLFSASNGQPNGAKNEAVAEKPVAEKPKGRKRRVKADQDDDDYE
eukprot:s508_g14.t1